MSQSLFLSGTPKNVIRSLQDRDSPGGQDTPGWEMVPCRQPTPRVPMGFGFGMFGPSQDPLAGYVPKGSLCFSFHIFFF